MVLAARRLPAAVALAAACAVPLVPGQVAPARMPVAAERAARWEPPVHPVRMTHDDKDRPYFVLRWHGENDQGYDYEKLIARLRNELDFPARYPYTRIPRLLSDAPRRARENCPQALRTKGALHELSARTWFCLDSRDSTIPTTVWSPQGISGTWDARPAGTVDGARAFVFTWHHTDDDEARVTFLDELPDGFGSREHRYAHVLLVRPYVTAGRHVSYEDVPTHAGGVVWYHHYLLVADGPRGLLVFDLHNLFDLRRSPVGETGDRAEIGRHDGRYSAHTSRYVLPEIGEWVTDRPHLGAHCHAEHARPCFTYAGLDRSTSPPSILTGEWCRPDSRCTVGRVVRWFLDGDATGCVRGCLMTGPDGLARATSVYTQPSPYIQGGVSWRGRYFFSESHDSHQPGRLFTAVPGRRPRAFPAGIGVEDLYWHRATSPPALWSLTEFAGLGRRVLYEALPRSREFRGGAVRGAHGAGCQRSLRSAGGWS